MYWVFFVFFVFWHFLASVESYRLLKIATELLISTPHPIVALIFFCTHNTTRDTEVHEDAKATHKRGSNGNSFDARFLPVKIIAGACVALWVFSNRMFHFLFCSQNIFEHGSKITTTSQPGWHQVIEGVWCFNGWFELS